MELHSRDRCLILQKLLGEHPMGSFVDWLQTGIGLGGSACARLELI